MWSIWTRRERGFLERNLYVQFSAKTFFDTLVLNAGSTENIVIDAGYPFHFGTLTENLRFAAEDERAEFTEVYPAFAEEALASHPRAKNAET